MHKNILKIFVLIIVFMPLKAQNKQALWVVRDMLKSKASIDKVVHYAAQNKIDILFVQVRGRGSVYYHSEYEEYETPEIGFDPLAYLLEKSKNTSVEIHAWFNLYLVWSQTDKPESAKHPLNRFPDAILKDYNFENYSKKMSKTVEGHYLSPFHNEVNDYLTNMVHELLEHYALDGIHFDYIRYPNSNFIVEQHLLDYISNKFGFSPLLLKKYPDSSSSDLNSRDNFKKQKIIQETYSRIIGEFLKNIYGWINDRYPRVLVSAAVKPDPFLAKIKFYQDWISWLENDYLDFVVIMNYSRNDAQFEKNLIKIKSTVDISRVMVGIGCYNKPLDQIQNQILLARNHQYGSFSFFSYKHLRYKSLKNLLK